ncbi:MAG: WecB/TagA/CpsF family glycosyltransferase [Kiloniellales bacterium]
MYKTPSTLRLFGLTLFNGSRGSALDRLLQNERPLRVAFVNAHCVNVAAKDADYRQSLDAADVLLPDGSGIAIAARMSGDRLQQNLNGTDLFPPLCREAAKRGRSLFLLGARPGVAEAVADAARSLAPGLEIAGCLDGYAGLADEDATVRTINESGADILLVALGVPLQELWLQRNAPRLRPGLTMGVGGLFDFYSGRIARAPRTLRALGMEWAWRLAMEPRRMARRYLLGNPAFLLRAARQAVGEARQPRNEEPGGKRLLDLVGALTILTVLAPLLLSLAVAIKATSRGPVLFRQERVGKGGSRFSIFKFRSMYCDAEERRAALLAKSDRKGVCFKVKKDPRVTPVGRFLRRFSLDELPQLLNVVNGEMSLVGPRPALPQEVAAYPSNALERLNAKPGLTGVWQVSGRAEIGFTKMVDMDVAYVRARSSLLDLVLLVLTVKAVIGGRGAY